DLGRIRLVQCAETIKVSCAVLPRLRQAGILRHRQRTLLAQPWQQRLVHQQLEYAWRGEKITRDADEIRRQAVRNQHGRSGMDSRVKAGAAAGEVHEGAPGF